MANLAARMLLPWALSRYGVWTTCGPRCGIPRGYTRRPLGSASTLRGLRPPLSRPTRPARRNRSPLT